MNERIDENLIDICVCTFKRPQIIDTLRSISKLALEPQWRIRVIVADNDATQSARNIVEAVAAETGMELTYVHAPAANISIARNACLETASAPFIAFIDDDECVCENWLIALMEEMRASRADAVLGPVRAIYNDTCPAWIAEGNFHSTRPIFVKGKIITGYSGNVLMRRQSPVISGLRFRADFGKTGGEDTAFFSSVYKAGGIISYAPEALATELVEQQRATFGWLFRRYLRAGQTHGILLLEETGTQIINRVKQSIKASAKAGFCMAAAPFYVRAKSKMLGWFLRGTLHVGVVHTIIVNKKSNAYEQLT